MAAFGFLFDENVDPVVRHALESRVADVACRTVGDADAPVRGSPDPAILNWCEENGFALVTNNRATMAVHLAAHVQRDRHVLAVFMLNPQMSPGDTALELELIWELAEPDDFRDRITYLPL